jgi:hypothetical protein
MTRKGEFYSTGDTVPSWEQERKLWRPGYWLIRPQYRGYNGNRHYFDNRESCLAAWEMLGKEDWHPYRICSDWSWMKWNE